MAEPAQLSLSEWPNPKGDPRARFPELAAKGVFTDRRMRRWLEDRRCLCGCGRRTKFLRGRTSGGWSYFTNRCWPKLAREVGLSRAPSAPVTRDALWLASVRRENDDRLCSVEDTAWYANMILADCEDRGITVAAWAREKGVTDEWARQMIRASRYGTRIAKFNAGVILKALGERMPTDIRQRYEARQRRRRRQKVRVSLPAA